MNRIIMTVQFALCAAYRRLASSGKKIRRGHLEDLRISKGAPAKSLRVYSAVFILSLGAWLAACGQKMVPASVEGYNHMPESGFGISGFSINGGSGPNVAPESGGGGSNCCVRIPLHWHSGMKAKVEWSYDTAVGDDRTPPPPQEAELEIPDYSKDGPGSVQVHFYANHRIKVVVSNYDIRHPQYPMTAADKLPWVSAVDSQ